MGNILLFTKFYVLFMYCYVVFSSFTEYAKVVLSIVRKIKISQTAKTH